jgi:hypothetical protein
VIIKSPTGAFSRSIPQSPDDSGAVTWTISNQLPPPRIPAHVVKAPLSVILTNTPVPVNNRNDLGELIFTYVKGAASTTGSNKKSFEPGEILTFSDDTPVSTGLTPSNLGIQHNTNILDLAGLGLSSEEISKLSADAHAKASEIRTQINLLQKDIRDLQLAIRENQKDINEATKAIDASGVLFGITAGTNDSGNDVYDKLIDTREGLREDRINLNLQLTTKQSELQTAQDNLINLSQLVR